MVGIKNNRNFMVRMVFHPFFNDSTPLIFATFSNPLLAPIHSYQQSNAVVAQLDDGDDNLCFVIFMLNFSYS